MKVGKMNLDINIFKKEISNFILIKYRHLLCEIKRK